MIWQAAVVTEMLAVLIPALTAIGVVFLAHRAAKKREFELKYLERQSDAYIAYLAAVAKLAAQIEPESSRAALAEAKARISILGSATVVHSLAQLERAPDLAGPGVEPFLNVLEAMRLDGERDLARRDDLAAVALGIGRSTTQYELPPSDDRSDESLDVDAST